MLRDAFLRGLKGEYSCPNTFTRPSISKRWYFSCMALYMEVDRDIITYDDALVLSRRS